MPSHEVSTKKAVNLSLNEALVQEPRSNCGNLSAKVDACDHQQESNLYLAEPVKEYLKSNVVLMQNMIVNGYEDKRTLQRRIS